VVQVAAVEQQQWQRIVWAHSGSGSAGS
jgi:hypothetical protein